jgi:hypothetical protein
MAAMQRNRFGRSRRTARNGSLLGVPDRLRTKLRLNASINIADADTFTDTIVKLNDPLDPLSGVGAAEFPQWDQLKVLWGRYKIHGSKLRVRGGVSAAAAVGSYGLLRVCVVPLASSTTYSDFATPSGGRHSKVGEAQQPYEKLDVTNAVSVAKVAGSSTNMDRFQALVTNEPAEIIYWHICTVYDVTTTSQNLVLNIDLEVDIEMFERLTPVDSLVMMRQVVFAAERKELLRKEKELQKGDRPLIEPGLPLSQPAEQKAPAGGKWVLTPAAAKR